MSASHSFALCATLRFVPNNGKGNFKSKLFGFAPAMALTALRKSADRGRDSFPEASDAIKKNSYMDDLSSSVESLAQAVQLTNEIDHVLNRYGFVIKKWIFNETSQSSL